jgi:hypothetical protein
MSQTALLNIKAALCFFRCNYLEPNLLLKKDYRIIPRKNTAIEK